MATVVGWFSPLLQQQQRQQRCRILEWTTCDGPHNARPFSGVTATALDLEMGRLCLADDDRHTRDPRDNHGCVEADDLAAHIRPRPEEDGGDVYWSHRKKAFQMKKLADDHLRAARDAFWRGNHIFARRLSLKARHEQIAAEKLQAEAARKILRIHNCNNDVWKLDLHGLHAAEAVNALKEHLHRIESQGVVPHQRQRVLHVITGKGNHSRGQPVLPGIVRTFLTENGYRFDDARPGMINVWPKF